MKKSWHDQAFFGLHFDIHTTEADRNIGKYADADQLEKQFRRIQPDFVQCDCKGHAGYSSYPTKVGNPAPGIVKDQMKEWREATRRLHIPLILHFSGVWDTYAIHVHPEWAAIPKPDGEPSPNITCPLSPYTKEYMIPQLEELIRDYDVDGFWVDGENWASGLCYCDRCTKAFREKTGYTEIPHSAEDAHWDEWLQFHRGLFEEHVTTVSDAIHKANPNCTSCSNWMYTIRQPEAITVPVDYISGDFSWIWSNSRALLEAKYMDTRGINWDLMAWGFTTYQPGPGRRWIFKSVDALCQEAGIVMANGGTFTVYDTPNRWGTVVDWHMDDLAEVAGFCRARRAFCKDSKAVPQAAILHNAAHYYAHNDPLYNYGTSVQPIEGALHAVNQNGISVNILSDCDLLRDLDKYPLCVIPEQTRISDELRERLVQYVKDGGALVVSGETCKIFETELGVRISDKTPKGYFGQDMEEFRKNPDEGIDPTQAAWFFYNVNDEISVQVGRRTQPLVGEWMCAENISADACKPILASRDCGEDRKELPYAAATIKRLGKGRIAGIYGPAFDGYFLSNYPLMREFFGEIFDHMGADALVRADAPASISISVREKNSKLQVHFVNLSCDPPTAPNSSTVETVPDAGPVSVSIPMEKEPKTVLIQPEGRPAHWTLAGGKLYVTLPRIGIHDILEIEP